MTMPLNVIPGRFEAEPKNLPEGFEAVQYDRCKRGPDGVWNVVVETWWEVEPIAAD
ncbi:hypothetical protein [Jiella avicenniae]|uniref:Uncharacterized protein n=1 Tax=Jiella avicenniae TaxID=2907202 RepID=A0A9X1P0B3_9HYPH|nr:hypothetical protein [Jiella avicenniae]MCE7028942.1 hypothetical protein [Jiella avicenniae]